MNRRYQARPFMAHQEVEPVNRWELVLGIAVLFGCILVIVVWLGIYP